MATFVLGNESNLSLGSIYMNMMRHLSDATKLEIINLLSASILHKEEKQEKQISSDVKIDLYTCFKGDWGKGKSTAEYCNELRRDLIPPKKLNYDGTIFVGYKCYH